MTIRTWNLLVLACAAALLAGCPGGGGALACGPNTIEVDGECVTTVDDAPCGEGASPNEVTGQCEPDVACGPGTSYDAAARRCKPDAVCGAGTSLNEVSGRCEPDVECGPDTTFDPTTETCRPNVVCGIGTHVDEDTRTCVPDDSCGTGTTFDPQTGTCVADLLCGPGLSNIGGVCLSALDVIIGQADAFEASIDNNDPAFGGVPERFSAEAIGQRSVFTGTIDRPIDRNGDTVPDQDRDVWRFTGTAGQIFRVRVLSTGAFQPAFTVSGPNGYYREPQLGFAIDADRQIVLPYDGDYDITVLPSLVLQNVSDPIGGDEAIYGGVVEQLAWPNPVDLEVPLSGALATASGSLFGLLDNFFAISTDTLLPVVLEATAPDTGTEPVLLLFDASKALLRIVELDEDDGIYTGLALAVASADDGLIALLDWRTSAGVDAGFTLSASAASVIDLGVVGVDETAVWPREVVTGYGGVRLAFEVTAGQVILSDLNGLSTSTSELTLFSPSGAVLYEGRYSTSPPLIFHAEESGVYEWLVLNGATSDARLAPAIVSSTPRLLGPYDGNSVQTASFSGDRLGPLVRPGGEWFLVETTGDALLRFDFDRSSGTPLFELYPLDDDGGVGARRINTADDPASLRRWHTGPDRSLLRYNPGNVGRTPDPVVLDWRVDLTVLPPPLPGDFEPNDTVLGAQPLTVPARMLGEIANNESDVFAVTVNPPLAAGEALLIDVESLTATSSTLMRIRTPGGTLADPPLFYSAQAPLTRWMLLPTHNLPSFVLELEGTNSDGLTYVLEMRRVLVASEMEPNNDAASATDLGTVALAGLPLEAVGTLADKGGSSGPIDTDVYVVTLSEPLPPGASLRVRVDELVEANDLTLTLSYSGSAGGQTLTSRHEEATLLAAPLPGVPLFISVSDTETAGTDHDLYRVVIDVLDATESEPNDDVFSATPLSPLTQDSSAEIFGVANRHQLDFYRVDLASPLTLGEALFVRWGATLLRGIIDVEVQDASGARLLGSRHYAGELVLAPHGSAGPLYVRVSPDGTSTTTTAEVYWLEVERRSTSDLIEVEPNDTLATAQPIPAHTVLQGTTNDTTVDLFSLTLPSGLVPGETLLVEGFVPFRNDDVQVRVLNQAGAQLAMTQDILPFLEVPLPNIAEGTRYYVEVISAANVADGEEERYELRVDVGAL